MTGVNYVCAITLSSNQSKAQTPGEGGWHAQQLPGASKQEGDSQELGILTHSAHNGDPDPAAPMSLGISNVGSLAPPDPHWKLQVWTQGPVCGSGIA